MASIHRFMVLQLAHDPVFELSACRSLILKTLINKASHPYRPTYPPLTHALIFQSKYAGRPELPPAEIVRSLEILANRAHNRLQGGWDEFAVRRQWPYAYEIQAKEEKAAEESLPRSVPDAENRVASEEFEA